MSRKAEAEKALMQKAQIVLLLSRDYTFHGSFEWNAAALGQFRGLSMEVGLCDGVEHHAMSARVCSAAQAASEGIVWKMDREVPDRVVILEASVPIDRELCSRQMERNAVSDPSCKAVSASEEAIRECAAAILDPSLQKLGGDLLLAMGIALPGAWCLEMQCIVDGNVQSRGTGATTLPNACAVAREAGWPQIGELPLSHCLHWLDGIPGFEDAVPKGRAGHAVAALSHLTGTDLDWDSGRGSVGLMWCMVGLEALYNSGREGLAAQFRDKVWLLLGKDQARQKAFSRLYDYRSRFVHGSLDFPLAYCPWDSEDYSSLVIKAEQEQELAVALLVATLQSMVRDGIHELPFRWALGEA